MTLNNIFVFILQNMHFKTFKKIARKQNLGQESGWKTDASQLSAGVKPAAKLCLGPKGPFGNDDVGNTGLLGPPDSKCWPLWAVLKQPDIG